jgi:NAD(P)-dependent dehydrogenase (short-subunit alcohol dehydrogenase family)
MGAGRGAYVATRIESLLLGRLGAAEEAGSAVLFLMTNRWMTGATHQIDGGSRFIWTSCGLFALVV